MILAVTVVMSSPFGTPITVGRPMNLYRKQGIEEGILVMRGILLCKMPRNIFGRRALDACYTGK